MEPVSATGGEAGDGQQPSSSRCEYSIRRDENGRKERKGKEGEVKAMDAGGGAWIMRGAKHLGDPETWADCVDHTCPRMSRLSRQSTAIVPS